MMIFCDFCQVLHSSASCFHPANPTRRKDYNPAELTAALSAATVEAERLKGICEGYEAKLAEIKYYTRDHVEPGHECVECIIEAIISGELTPSLFTEEDLAAAKKDEGGNDGDS